MSGVQFEQYCAAILDCLMYSKIQKTPTKGDKGVDLLAWKALKKYAIQCKRYEKNVGNHAIQEMYTGKRSYAASDAIVMTNSHFTKQAIEDAKDCGVVLWDREKLISMIETANMDM